MSPPGARMPPHEHNHFLTSDTSIAPRAAPVAVLKFAAGAGRPRTNNKARR